MTTARAWAIFDYWFNWHGHWVFGTSDADKARAEEAWKQRGIYSLPDYPGPRPD